MVNNYEKSWPRGCLQIYTGDGKGKTTAAFGLAVRASGAGLRVYIGQFLKLRDCAEVTGLKLLGEGLCLERFGSGNWAKPGDPQERELALRGLERAYAALTDGYDLVILDEILGALRLQLLELSEVIDLVATRPADVELVLTGREAPAELIALADLVSEIRAVKHYYASGLPARRGIEY